MSGPDEGGSDRSFERPNLANTSPAAPTTTAGQLSGEESVHSFEVKSGNMSPTTQAISGEPDEGRSIRSFQPVITANISLAAQTTSDEPKEINGDVQPRQSTELSLSSPLPTPSPDLLATLLKIPMENSALQVKLAEKLATEIAGLRAENAALHTKITKITESSSKANDQLSIEINGLRQELVAFKQPTSLANNSTVPDSTVDSPGRFACFPRLPPELRLMVWKLVAQQPRVVEIRKVHRQWTGNSYKAWPAEALKYNSKYFQAFNNTPPAILHVNQESRKEALGHYKLGAIGEYEYQTYFNPDCDVMYCAFDYRGHGFQLIDDLSGDWTTISRIALRLDTIARLVSKDPDTSTVHAFACDINLAEVKEILLVDEMFAENAVKGVRYGSVHHHLSRPSLNQDKDLNLVKLNSLDMLKAKARHGWAEDDLSDPLVGSVEEFVEDVYDPLRATSNQEWSTNFEELIDEGRLTVTAARLEFRDTEAEVEGGRRHIYYML